MKLKKDSIQGFARRMKEEEREIVIYGAGVIGQVIAPYWLEEFQLAGQVRCYIDADPHKQGAAVAIGGQAVRVLSPEALREMGKGCVLLVTVSAFDSVTAALEKIPELEEAEAYFLPVMLIERARALKSGGVVKTSETPLIPKKLHYCWFSGNPIPDSLKRCMETWEKFCPDYEIVRWDESNYDISWSPYMVQAYEKKKWGFVVDMARLDLLCRYGGVFLDTDVELIRNLDELLYQPAFCGVEKWGVVTPGGCSGAQAGNPAFQAMRKFRQRDCFTEEAGPLQSISSGFSDTLALCELGLTPDGATHILENVGMTVYGSEFFHPFDYASGETTITENTFSIHHFSGTWLGENAARARARTQEKYQRFVSHLEESL